MSEESNGGEPANQDIAPNGDENSIKKKLLRDIDSLAPPEMKNIYNGIIGEISKQTYTDINNVTFYGSIGVEIVDVNDLPRKLIPLGEKLIDKPSHIAVIHCLPMGISEADNNPSVMLATCAVILDDMINAIPLFADFIAEGHEFPEILANVTNPQMAQFAINQLGFHEVSSSKKKQVGVYITIDELIKNIDMYRQKLNKVLSIGNKRNYFTDTDEARRMLLKRAIEKF